MEFYYNLEEKILEADSLMCQREFAKAKLKLEEILETEPDNGMVHYMMGWIYNTQLCNYKKAERHFNYAVKFSPDHPDVFYSYLPLLNKMERTNELIRIAALALIVKGVSKAFVYNQLGLSCEKTGNYSDAIRNFKQATVHATDNQDTEEYNESIQRNQSKLLAKEKFVYVFK